MKSSYITDLQSRYGAKVTNVDFDDKNEKTRLQINKFVFDKTQGKIGEFIKPGKYRIILIVISH